MPREIFTLTTGLAFLKPFSNNDLKKQKDLPILEIPQAVRTQSHALQAFVCVAPSFLSLPVAVNLCRVCESDPHHRPSLVGRMPSLVGRR